jgi:hypothetical protein
MRSGGPTFDPGAPPFWQSIDLSHAYRQVTAFLAAIFTGVLTLFILPQFLGELTWFTEAIAGVVVAMVWMGVGALLSRAHPATCTLLLITGSGLARFLSFGISASVSLYHGMATYIPATLAGGVVWMVVAHRNTRRVAWPLLCTLLIALVQLSRVALFGLPGEPRTMYRDKESVRVSIVPMMTSSELTYLWQPAHSKAFARVDSMTASVDLDASGASPHSLFRVTDRVEHSNVCRRLDVRTRQLVEAEIANGSIPHLVAALPLRKHDCSAGTIWRVVRR